MFINTSTSSQTILNISASICTIRKNTRKIRLYSILEIASVVIWNPFYAFKYTLPGVGYILYIISLIPYYQFNLS